MKTCYDSTTEREKILKKNKLNREKLKKKKAKSSINILQYKVEEKGK